MDVKTLLIEELHELVCSSGDQGNIIKYRKELLASGKISAECDEAIESVLEAMADLECAAQDAVDTLEEESEED